MMKGKSVVIETLNDLLADELTAIDQYMVHAEMFDNWGYAKLAVTTEKRAVTEMKHAEKHISRILFLEGKPLMSHPLNLNIGSEVKAMLENDKAAETGAVVKYNLAIKTIGDAGDFGTQDILKGILADEEAHLDWLEAQLDQISQMGLATYLTEQLEG
jgi:bacterioferritin